MANETQEVKQVRNDSGLIQQTMEISKRVGKPGEKGQNAKVGDVTYFVPDLEAFRLDTVELDSVDDDGLPIYKDAAHNWLYSAVVAAVKSAVRNKLVSGTAAYKEGLSAPASLEALMAEGEGRTGEALKRLQALKREWNTWAESLKKSAEATKMLKGYFASPDNLALQPQGNRDKFGVYLMQFLSDQPEEFQVTHQKYLDNLIAACKSQIEAEDF